MEYGILKLKKKLLNLKKKKKIFYTLEKLQNTSITFNFIS